MKSRRHREVVPRPLVLPRRIVISSATGMMRIVSKVVVVVVIAEERLRVKKHGPARQLYFRTLVFPRRKSVQQEVLGVEESSLYDAVARIRVSFEKMRSVYSTSI